MARAPGPYFPLIAVTYIPCGASGHRVAKLSEFAYTNNLFGLHA